MAFADYSFVDSSDFIGDAFFMPPYSQEKTTDEQTSTGPNRNPSTPPVKRLRLAIKKKLKERHEKKSELAPTAPDEVYSAGA